MNNLTNFPAVNCITLEKSYNRQRAILAQINKYNLKYKFHYAYDCVNNEISDMVEITGNHIHNMGVGNLCTTLSHLNAIMDWHNSSEEDYGFFCEDDVMLSLSEYWPFQWNDFMSKVKTDLKIIQLSLIRSDLDVKNIESFIKIHNRLDYSWSACAYILSKDYAKKLIDRHCVSSNSYSMDIPNFPNTIPDVESVLYNVYNEQSAKTFPIFIENVGFTSCFYPKFIESTRKNHQEDCANIVKNWWINNDNHKNINYFLENV